MLERPNGVIDFSDAIAEMQVLLINLQWLEPEAGWGFSHPTIAPLVPLYSQSGLYAVEIGQLGELVRLLRVIHRQAVERRFVRAK